MECQRYTPKQVIRCPYWDNCHQLQVCLCEVEPYDNGTLPPTQQTRTKKTSWPERHQQLLDFAKQHKTIDTAMVMELTGAANGTACNWLKSLVREGELIRLTRAVLAGANSRPATFTIAEKEKQV